MYQENYRSPNLTIQLNISYENSISVAISESVEAVWNAARKQWRVISTKEDGSILWVGYGESITEAVMEYLKARLGLGYACNQLEAYEAGILTIEEFAESLGLELSMLQKFLLENEK